VARKNNITHSTVVRILKKKTISSTKNESKFSKFTPTQLEKILRCSRFLLRKHFCDQKLIVMDDEKNLTFSHSTLREINGFWTDDVENTPDAVKYKIFGKFELKVLVWCAISEAVIFTTFIGTVKGQAVDAAVYITKCLPKMDKFIEKHHKNDDKIFWLDHAKKTLEWLEQKNIKIVPKAALKIIYRLFSVKSTISYIDLS
jgi:hypothetical protein